MDETAADHPALKRTVLDLFTEIAILEHLIRTRLEPIAGGELSVQQFGVINHFCRQAKAEDRLAMLAWKFQVDEQPMAEAVSGLAALGLVTLDGGRDPCVRITAAGRALHAERIDAMAPEVLPLLEGLTREDLDTTTRTLTELRRTLDNLPDR